MYHPFQGAKPCGSSNLWKSGLVLSQPKEKFFIHEPRLRTMRMPDEPGFRNKSLFFSEFKNVLYRLPLR
jgi:hypothetical protein